MSQNKEKGDSFSQIHLNSLLKKYNDSKEKGISTIKFLKYIENISID